MRKYYGLCIFYLVVKEFSEILHIHSALTDIDNRDDVTKLCIVKSRIRDSLNNVGELSYSRRLNKHSVGMKFIYNLHERLGKIAY